MAITVHTPVVPEQTKISKHMSFHDRAKGLRCIMGRAAIPWPKLFVREGGSQRFRSKCLDAYYEDLESHQPATRQRNPLELLRPTSWFSFHHGERINCATPQNSTGDKKAINIPEDGETTENDRGILTQIPRGSISHRVDGINSVVLNNGSKIVCDKLGGLVLSPELEDDGMCSTTTASKTEEASWYKRMKILAHTPRIWPRVSGTDNDRRASLDISATGHEKQQNVSNIPDLRLLEISRSKQVRFGSEQIIDLDIDHGIVGHLADLPMLEAAFRCSLNPFENDQDLEVGSQSAVDWNILEGCEQTSEEIPQSGTDDRLMLQQVRVVEMPKGRIETFVRFNSGPSVPNLDWVQNSQDGTGPLNADFGRARRIHPLQMHPETMSFAVAPAGARGPYIDVCDTLKAADDDSMSMAKAAHQGLLSSDSSQCTGHDTIHVSVELERNKPISKLLEPLSRRRHKHVYLQWPTTSHAAGTNSEAYKSTLGCKRVRGWRLHK